jgi:hypothetical protein
MEHTPLPWFVEKKRDREMGDFFEAITEDGRTIVDTFNSGVALIREEVDGDENGSHVTRWDDQGKADIEFIVRAVNAFEPLKTALEDLRRAASCLEGSPSIIGEIRQARAALALADKGLAELTAQAEAKEEGS